MDEEVEEADAEMEEEEEEAVVVEEVVAEMEAALELEWLSSRMDRRP